MVPHPTVDPTELLIERKFGTAAESNGFTVAISATRRARTDPRLAKQIAQYRAYLGSLSPEDFNRLLDSERVRQEAELVAKAELTERGRFFNQPHADADFEHWSRAAHWTLDEAVALSFGKAPELVKWEQVESLVSVSPFAFQYFRRRDLARRALDRQQLTDPVFPGFFLAWAKLTDLDYPAELEAAVKARGAQVADWASLFEKLKVETEERETHWLASIREKSAAIECLRDRIGELEAELASIKAPQPGASSEKSLGARERESLLKLVIGMAVRGYGYDRTASKSSQTTEIASDLELSGVSLDVDTVRKWLRMAAELLPPRETE